MFYPMWWLNLVGYWNIGGNPHGIYFEPNFSDTSGTAEPVISISSVFLAVGVALLGFAYGRFSSVQRRRKEYIPI